MSATFLKMALEELDQGIFSKTDQTVLSEYSENDASAEDAQVAEMLKESQAISKDTDVAIESIAALEDLAFALESSFPAGTPVPSNTLKIVNIALEAIIDDFEVVNDSPGIIGNIKEKAKKLLERLLQMIAEIGIYCKNFLVKIADTTIMNANRADIIRRRLHSKRWLFIGDKLPSITDSSLIKVIATKNGQLVKSYHNLVEYYSSAIKSLTLLNPKKASEEFSELGDGQNIDRVNDLLIESINSTYSSIYVGNTTTTEKSVTKTSNVFPGNIVAYMDFPKDNNPDAWKHGIRPNGDFEPPKEIRPINITEALEILELIIGLTDSIMKHKTKLLNLDKYEREISQSIKRATTRLNNINITPSKSTILRNMASVTLKSIKGPHVDALALLTRVNGAMIKYSLLTLRLYEAVPTQTDTK